MKRLTNSKAQSGEIVCFKRFLTGELSETQTYKLAENLYSYENTGLTPEQIAETVEQLHVTKKEIEQLHELVKLAFDGANGNCKTCAMLHDCSVHDNVHYFGGEAHFNTTWLTDCELWSWQHANKARKLGVEL